jgi:hypothetical protein
MGCVPVFVTVSESLMESPCVLNSLLVTFVLMPSFSIFGSLVSINIVYDEVIKYAAARDCKTSFCAAILADISALSLGPTCLT